MKTLVCLIAVLLMTAPVLATTVTISGEVDGNNLTLKYHTDGVLRGIALTLSCSDAATADASDVGTVTGANWNVCLDYAYDVVTAAGTYNLNDGGPLAKIDGPGVPVGPVSDFSICVGYVDEGGLGAGVLPGSQAVPEDLCTIVLSGDCTVTVAADMLRGGAVGSPVDIILDMDNDGSLKDTIDVGDGDCFTGTPEQVQEWNDHGQPQNWCGDCWTCGDVNGDCYVTFGDVDDTLAYFNAADTTGRGDANMDGYTTFGDVDYVLALFNAGDGCTACGPCTPPE